MDDRLPAECTAHFFPSEGKGKPSVATTDAKGRYRAIVSSVQLTVMVGEQEIVDHKVVPLDTTDARSPVVKDVPPAVYTPLATTSLVAAPVAGATTTLDVAFVSPAKRLLG